MTLKPWREVIVPHSNVLEGTFQESEFAADISKVANGQASPEYQDPALFFERTYITEGMGLLLDSVVKRLSGKGGDPVVQLQTAFGGGKTHAMLAVYHLSRGEKPAKELQGIPTILDRARIAELPRARVAVIDGNALSASQPRKRGSVEIKTIWGEMAWQLGGEEGFRMLEKADSDGTSPGKEILAEIFKRFSPCIVLMDETVAYVRQFEKGKSYAGGTFESNMSFIQALTESAGHVPTAMVLASLPESDLEVGGERGKHALKQVEHLFHRLEAIWKPVAPEEGFEIVRRRLFGPVSDERGRDDVCRAFSDMYIEAGTFPAQTRESSYYDRIKNAYPIHPEVFDRLYEDWSVLENFQRTRGVLRLMAMVVHRLWSDGNQDLMIMPGSFPLYDSQVRNELIRYLPQGWEPVLDRDCDGARAMTSRIDEQSPLLGSVSASRRVARSIFLGSSPSTSGQKIRGINSENIRLGCTQPGWQVGRFDDALRKLKDQLHYLYSSEDRYWYDTQTNLRREAEDRISRFNKDEHLIPEIESRLKSILKGGAFDGIHVFTNHSDVPDDALIRLVVLSPSASHQWHQKKSPAIALATETLSKRGSQPRLNQNRLVFFAADTDSVGNLYEHVKRFLAWQSIVNEKHALNLDQHRLREATKNCSDADERLKGVISEAYKWILAPYQEKNGEKGLSEIIWEEQGVPATSSSRMDAIAAILEQNELLISRWSPFHLKNILDMWYWKDGGRERSLSKLWQDFCRYCYLPRLKNSSVLSGTVSDGIESQDFFAYASGKDGDNYLGLKFGTGGSVYLDENSILVHPAAALEQYNRSAEAALREADSVAESMDGKETPAVATEAATPETESSPVKTRTRMTRFHGSANLDPIRAALDFSSIAENVIQHFSSRMGVDVRITLEIEAVSKTGFDDATMRTVKENSNTLKLKHAEFEEE